MPDVRLIDANALKEKLQADHDFYINAWGGFKNLPANDKARVDELTASIAAVVNAPTIDAVEVVHGRWLDCENYNDIRQCSECGLIRNIYKQEGWKYCPNCGTKMDANDMDAPTKDGGAADGSDT